MSTQEIADINAQLVALSSRLDSTDDDMNSFWIMIGSFLVFFMQTGFAMLEVGSVSVKNTKNILIKNLFDAVIGSICWWAVGMAFAMGNTDNGFIGTDGFFLSGPTYFSEDGKTLVGRAYSMWLFQWAFAATGATIVSGAIAERVTFGAYVCYSVILTCIIYPVVVCWIWNSGGWASAWKSTEDETLLFGCGVIDFAGSCVVHMLGGIAALVAAKTIGPRIGRFAPDGTPCELPQQSAVLQSLGTLILWMGWFGFNGASTLYIVGYAGVSAKVCINTTLAGAAASLSCVVLGKLRDHIYDPGLAQNGLLAGLVAVTAGCSVMEPEGALLVGIIAGPVYFYASALLRKLQIDDVVDAVPVHLCNGMWGTFAAALFATPINYEAAYYTDRMTKCSGFFYGGSGAGIAANLVAILATWAWALPLCVVMFVGLNKTIGLRVNKEMEQAGMDISKHGGITYPEMQLNLKQYTNAKQVAVASVKDSVEVLSGDGAGFV